MNTINISLPDQLKGQADKLIEEGYYASFSDLVRTALRTLIVENKYDRLAKEAIEEHRLGKSKTLRSKKDIETFVNTIMS
jgi:putative addiction module CopG family antidote